MIKFNKKVLKNGLRVIVAPMENTEAVTLLALVGAGSRNETKNINGVSHFLEHMFFKGTKGRPKPGQIHKELDRIGAVHNAFTGKEVTGFWVKSSRKDFDTSLDIVSDILINPVFKKEEIEKEKNVILQEISMYEDEPRRKVWETLENIMYGDQPLGWDIAGTKEIVGKIKRSDIVGYRNDNYLSKNIIVAVAGNIDDKIVFEKIESHFGKIKMGKNKNPKKVKIIGETPKVKIIKKELDQTHLAISFMSYDMYDEKRYALNLLTTILGGNSSSTLFREIREKLGLAYYVFAGKDQFLDSGYLGIGAGVAHSEAERTAKMIIKIIKKIKETGVTKKELKDAKSFMRGQMALSMEGTDEIANYCAGRELFYGKIIQPEEIMKKIEKVSQNDILNVAREIFIPSKASMVSIGVFESSQNGETYYRRLLNDI